MENGEVGMGVLLPGAINQTPRNQRRDTGRFFRKIILLQPS